MMPDMDGVEVTRRIRARNDKWCRQVPIVALSANVVAGNTSMFLDAGMNDFISKPIRAEEFNRILGKWLPADKQFSIAARNEAYIKHHHENGSVISQSVGIKNAANREDFYKNLLLSFKKDHAHDHQKLIQALRQGDTLQARQLAHTLKSTAGLIGAVGLQAAALIIEQSLTTGADVDMRHVREFESEFNAVMKELAQLAPDLPPVESTHEEINKIQAVYLVGKLMPLLSSKNTDSLNLINEINTTLAPLGENCSRLVEQIEDFDFDGALETLLTIRQMLMS
jgi:CheY-like chemotaxis protein